MSRPARAWFSLTSGTKGVAPAFSAPSVIAALGWLVIGLALAGWWAVERGSTGPSARAVVAALLAGFVAQAVLALASRVLPRGGRTPRAARAATIEVERWGTGRVAVANTGLALCLLPVPPLVRTTLATVTALALALALPLLARGALRARRRTAQSREVPAEPVVQPLAGRLWSRLELLTGVGIIAVATSLGIGLDPTASRLGQPQGRRASGAGTGRTRRVTVRTHDMRFHPDEVTIDAGDRLIITLENADGSEIHDLVLDDGRRSPRLSPGERATVDLGVVGADTDGWCSVVGHRQMGMVFHVTVRGGAGAPQADEASGQDGATVDFAKRWGADFTGIDPRLRPLDDERVREITLTVTDAPIEVAPGVTQVRWTYNGDSVAPTLHGRVGDRFVITMVNEGTMGHSIDFHASEVAPDRVMRTVPPGESVRYEFTARRSGIWMYHCATAPMSTHIAAGMAGAVVIEPEGLPPVDHSWVITQSELYLGAEGEPVNAEKVAKAAPDAVVFNGYVNQYVDRPLTAKVGERVRFWVLDIGPSRPLSFHVVGGQFDTVYLEGSYRLERGRARLAPRGSSGGSQALGLLPAQGGFVELTFPEVGHYPFVNHVMSDAEKGARGIVRVT